MRAIAPACKNRAHTGTARGFDIIAVIADHHGIFGHCADGSQGCAQMPWIGLAHGEAVAATKGAEMAI
jgi:hypothetical protein